MTARAMRWLAALAFVACSSRSPESKGAGSATAHPQGSATVATVDAASTTGKRPLAPGIELPEIPMIGAAVVDDAFAAISVSPSALSVEGKQIASVTNGRLDPAAIDGGERGMRVPKLAAMLEALGAAEPKRVTPPLPVAIDRTVPCRTMIQVLYSASTSKLGLHGAFLLLARSGSNVVGVPVTLPRPRPEGAPPPKLGMMLSIEQDRVLLWSSTGEAGTYAKPKATFPRTSTTLATDLGAALATIVEQHFAKERDGERPITFVVHPDTATQTVAELAGVVRATPDGALLFSTVMLAMAFE